MERRFEETKNCSGGMENRSEVMESCFEKMKNHFGVMENCSGVMENRSESMEKGSGVMENRCGVMETHSLRRFSPRLGVVKMTEQLYKNPDVDLVPR